MKIVNLTLLAVFLLNALHAQELVPVDKGSAVKFTIKNFGFNVSGDFSGLQGAIKFTPGNLPAAAFNVKVAASTINTGNGSRDGHLRKEEYFDVAKYPVLSFVSDRVTATSTPTRYLVEGKITIKGKTKVISFPFTAIPSGNGYLFEGSFKLNRRDFGVGGNSLVMSDNLTVSLAILTKKANQVN